MRLRAGLSLVLLLCAPALADTPLPPGDDWRHVHPGVVAEGFLDPPRVVITPAEGPAWALPFWIRPNTVHPSPDGQTVLVSNAGGNLLGWNGDRDATVLWVYAAPGEEVATVPLRALMRPRNLRPTVSHYVWITGYVWSVDGWAFETPDGQGWHLSTGLRLTRR